MSSHNGKLDRVKKYMRKNLKGCVLFTFSLVGVLLSGFFAWIGFQRLNRLLTTLSFVVFEATLLFSVGLFIKMRDDKTQEKGKKEWWWLNLMNGLGSLPLFKFLRIRQILGGAFSLAILMQQFWIYSQIIVGSGSFLQNDLVSIIWVISSWAFIFSSIHRNFNAIAGLKDLKDDQVKRIVSKYTNIVKRWSVLAFIIVGSLYVLISHLTTTWDGIYPILFRNFYNLSPYEGTAQLFLVYPMTLLPHIAGSTSNFILYGHIGIVAFLAIVNLYLFGWLGDEYDLNISPYRPFKIQPVYELLISFWLLTSTGLAVVPSALLISNQLESITPASARWLRYLAWGYPLPLVTLVFPTSIIRVHQLIRKAKTRKLRKLYKRLQDCHSKHDKEGIAITKEQITLLKEIKEWPHIATVMQVIQIIVTVSMSILTLYLG